MASKLTLPPLSLYIHLPWCIRKCPYCDFNSFVRPKENEQFKAYIRALLNELHWYFEHLGPLLENRPVKSIYLGGGTPSLFQTQDIEIILKTIYETLLVEYDAEISMEANPGTTNFASLKALKNIGINRLSLGVQSLNDKMLKSLGRIHDRATALTAIEDVANIFENYNIDLMHSLPKQNTTMALLDLEEVIKFSPPHISWYQLTIEPDSVFGCNEPDDLPSEDTIENTVLSGFKLLESKGYKHYEVSAFAKNNRTCRHNINYWRFGDYLALGAGAHSKLTLNDAVVRWARMSQPQKYIEFLTEPLQDSQPAFDTCTSSLSLSHRVCSLLGSCRWVEDAHVVPSDDLSFEYFLNRLRLFEGVPIREFTAYTGITLETVWDKIQHSIDNGLLLFANDELTITPKGHLFVNAMLEEFL